MQGALPRNNYPPNYPPKWTAVWTTPACYDGANRGAARAISGWVRAPRARTRTVSTSELTRFAALLKRYRVAAGLTQKELAERACLSVRGLSNLERGVRRLPQHATIELLAAALYLTGPDRATFEAAARGHSALCPTRSRPPG